jgi:hypothetical protein
MPLFAPAPARRMSNPKPYQRSWIEQTAYDSQQMAFALMRERQAQDERLRQQMAQQVAEAHRQKDNPFRRSDRAIAEAAIRASAFPCPR